MTTIHRDIPSLARRWFGKDESDLDDSERLVLGRTVERRPLSQDVNETFDGQLSFGERVADKVATFGGSWTFIISFCAFLACWAAANALLGQSAFDAYPFIFLNLLLSMIAALQAPVIMMSQARQAERDRLDARHDYEVNLKAEIEIMALHDKMDHLRTEAIEALLVKQQEQIDLLTRLLRNDRDV
ncbi:DUF1003 domain-containing protein [Hansschlegelia sp. KR7-227]|uniref:DUF1003 domain-containing protein n=1 Tax=Hansschlegelia sp. KR7-227 TaxID=3400914 RepID=UPI003C020F2B